MTESCVNMGQVQTNMMQDMTAEFRVDAVQHSALDQASRALWTQLREGNPALYSPYFSISYADHIAALRDDVRTLIISQFGQTIAFLPVQGGTFAQPVGAPMTDYHGIICSPKTELDIQDILAKAGIGSFHFSGLIGEGVAGEGEMIAATDISMGAQAWRAGKNKSYRRMIKDNNRRARKAQSEVGEITAKFNVTDTDELDQLLTWKRDKFAMTGKYDVLAAGWTEDLLRRLYAAQSPDLRCEMHVLYFDGRMAAADMGLTDGETFHSWMVGYDAEFQSYSPGSQLLEQLIDAAPSLGYRAIDLGPGLDGYKKHYSGIEQHAHSGFIAATGPAAALSRVYGAAERMGEKANFEGLTKLRRRYSQIAACDRTTKGRAAAMLSAIKNAGKS